MEDLTNLTPTELLKLGNDIKAQHDVLKNEIITLTFDAEELENKINEKVQILDSLEKKYVEIVEIITK